MTYEALTKAGVPLVRVRQLHHRALNFLILAFIIFVMVKQINRLRSSPAPRRRDARGRPPAARDPRLAATLTGVSGPRRFASAEREAVPELRAIFGPY